MKDPKFSIIIPCFNGKDYLKDCLLSIHKQTFQDFEVVFVDDNSNDGSFEFALELKETFGLKGEFFQKDKSIKKGVSSSRNLAITSSKGEWVVFLDCDDYFEPEKLELVNSFIEQNPNSFAIHHSYTKFGAEISNLLITVQEQKPHDFNFLIQGNPIGTSTVVVRKKLILELGGFNTRLNGVEDFFLWCRIAKKMGAWSYIPKPMTFYRYLSSSLMSSRKLSYYVNQTCNFYQEAKSCGEFNEKELRLIKNHLFFEELNYKMKISLDNYGLFDFLEGIRILIKKGEQKAAFHHLGIRLKNFTLFHLSKVVKSKYN